MNVNVAVLVKCVLREVCRCGNTLRDGTHDMPGLELRAIGQGKIPGASLLAGFNCLMVNDSLAENDFDASLPQDVAYAVFEVVWQWLCRK